MSGYPHAELVRLVGDSRDHFGSEKLADLDSVVPFGLLPAHDRARRLWVGHVDVAAPGARALGFEFAVASANGLSGWPDARAANFSEFGALLLGETPRTVLLRLDLHAGGDAEVQIEFAPERLPVTVA